MNVLFIGKIATTPPTLFPFPDGEDGRKWNEIFNKLMHFQKIQSDTSKPWTTFENTINHSYYKLRCVGAYIPTAYFNEDVR